MTSGRFDPSELIDADGSAPSDIELAAAMSMARELESRRGSADVRPSPGLADRVMSAIASEPPPRPAAWLRGGWSLTGLGRGLRDAWHVAVGGQGRPLGVRAAALGYVLVVVVGLAALGGGAALGAAGALGLLDGSPSATPSLPQDTPEPSPSSPPSLEPSTNPSTEPSSEPSESPSSSDDSSPPVTGPSASPDEGAEGPSASPSSEASDEPDGSDDHGGSSTPRPSDTPQPSGSGGSG